MSTKSFVSELLIETEREKIKGKAEGMMHISTGELLVAHEYAKAPRFFNLGLIGVGALTGTPEPERAIGKVCNPFRPAREYRFVRKVRFVGQRSGLTVRGRYTDDGNGGRIGSLRFTGEVPTMDRIVAVEPTTEIWLPGEKLGTINGAFVMSFLTESGRRVVAQTSTAYEVIDSPAAKDFCNPHFRYITIQHAYDKRTFKQEEQISLFQAPSQHVAKIENLTRILR